MDQVVLSPEPMCILAAARMSLDPRCLPTPAGSDRGVTETNA